jgi:hypothetical protein
MRLAPPQMAVLAHHDRPPFSGRPSLTEHYGHGWACRLPRPVAIDPQQTSDRKMRLHRTSRPPDVTMYSLPILADRPCDHGSNR